MGRNVKHTHLGKPVPYPKGMRPGDPIEWAEDDEPGHCRPPGSYSGTIEGATVRVGIVLDRAANSVENGSEASGVWVWVQPDENKRWTGRGSDPVRVRRFSSGRRKGQAWRDDGPVYVRLLTGMGQVLDGGHRYDAYYWSRQRRNATCVCHPVKVEVEA